MEAKKKNTKTIRRCRLEEDKYLVLENEIIESDIDEKNTRIEFLKKIPISLVSIEEIDSLRKSGQPGFIYKNGEKLYYAKLTKTLKDALPRLFKETHKCGETCKYMSAAPVELGGCPKVINRATYIERYPWIILGYETFNISMDAMYVAKCSNYKPCEPRETQSYSDRLQRSKSLEMFIYD